MLFLLKDGNNKYILNKKIGDGATCECYSGTKINEEKKEIYAIKLFNIKYYKFYTNEVSLLLKLNKNKNNSNFNIIKLYKYGQGTLYPLLNNNINNTDDDNKKIVYYQIMEYSDNGELKDYIKDRNSRLPENISAKIFIQIVNTVKYLHENNIAHCDIKPENILLDKNFIPKLNDFGFSQIFNGQKGDYTLHKFSGTTIYCSPDTKFAYTKGFDGIKNDIFSLGVLLFVITIGEFPYKIASYSDEKYKYIIKKKYGKFWEFYNNIEISDEFKDLINNLICITPSHRLSIDKILKHPWIIKNLGVNYIKYNNLYKIVNNNEVYDEELIEEFNSNKK